MLLQCIFNIRSHVTAIARELQARSPILCVALVDVHFQLYFCVAGERTLFALDGKALFRLHEFHIHVNQLLCWTLLCRAMIPICALHLFSFLLTDLFGRGALLCMLLYKI